MQYTVDDVWWYDAEKNSIGWLSKKYDLTAYLSSKDPVDHGCLRQLW